MEKKKKFLFNAIILLTLFTVITPINSKAASTNVVITLDRHDIVWEYEPNASKTLTITGSVSCNFSGFGSDAQSVKLDLMVSTNEPWPTSISPTTMVFYSNSEQSLNLTTDINVDATYNRTTNVIGVSGSYYIMGPYGTKIVGQVGQADPDQVNITLISETRPYFPSTVSGPIDAPTSATETEDFPMLVGFLLIPVVTIVLIVFYLKRKKS